VGVYVLGALEPAEREAFERHLSECEICPAEVADLGMIPGLLGRLDAETAFAVARDGEGASVLPGNWSDESDARPAQIAERRESPGARWAGPTASQWAGPTVGDGADRRGEDKVVTLLDAANRRRQAQKRRRRFATAAALLAAACLAVVVGLGVPVLFNNTPVQPKLTAMTAPAGVNVPVTAQLGLEPIASGTKVIMKCQYGGAPADYGSNPKWSLKLVAIPKSGGESEQLSDWMAGPGDEFQITATSKLKSQDISRIEMQSGNESKVLLVYQPA
jgi:anti-sigma factor RsiW